MMNRQTTEALWRKAAVLGSLWASSEIVLGSFLHNAKIPFRSDLLTFIGITILVAGHRLWPERGLLWRAGLICAAMKSVSPSAVVVGPMVAITMEGILLEIGTWIPGSLGYLLGGGLAMSWTFFHKVVKTLLFYGPDAAALYVKGWERFQSWLGDSTQGPWTPLIACASISFLTGNCAALIGIKLAGTSGREAAAGFASIPAAGLRPILSHDGRGRSWAVLFLHLGFIMGTMFFAKRFPLWSLALTATAYTLACSKHYPRAVQRLKRPGLWIGLLIACVMAGWLVGALGMGLRMAIRAIVLTLGFSAMGEEFRSAAWRSWLKKRGAGLFLETLDASFNTLPAIIAAIPSGKEIATKPLACLRHILAQAPVWLEAFEKQDNPQHPSRMHLAKELIKLPQYDT